MSISSKQYTKVCKVIVMVSTCSLPQVFLLEFCSPLVFCSANRWCGLRHPPLFQLHPITRSEKSLRVKGQSARVDRKTGKRDVLAIDVQWLNVTDLVAGGWADGGAENVSLLPHALNVPHAIRNHGQVDCSHTWWPHLFITLKKKKNGKVKDRWSDRIKPGEHVYVEMTDGGV